MHRALQSRPSPTRISALVHSSAHRAIANALGVLHRDGSSPDEGSPIQADYPKVKAGSLLSEQVPTVLWLTAYLSPRSISSEYSWEVTGLVSVSLCFVCGAPSSPLYMRLFQTLVTDSVRTLRGLLDME